MKVLSFLLTVIGCIALSMSSGKGSETPGKPPAEYQLPTYKVHDITLPLVEWMVKPRVSGELAGQEVTMLFAITAKGRPVDIHAEGLAWGCEDLASAMTSALRNWTFVPARDSEGRSITVQVAMPVRVVRKAGAEQAFASINLGNMKLVRSLL